jgi:hypothetical protein
MTARTKPLEAKSTLVFAGTRWPHARATAMADAQPVPRAGGTVTMHRVVAISVESGKGRTWTPESNDGSWRSLGELRLDDPGACEHFVRYRGDPFGTLAPGAPTTTLAWVQLNEALRLAASAWRPPDASGTSQPTDDLTCIRNARSFLAQVDGASRLLATLTVIPRFDGLLGLRPQNLAAYLLAKALHDMAPFRPMRRCQTCGFWFGVVRVTREASFCSSSCRAQFHQQEREQEKDDGVVQEEHHHQRHHEMAGGMADPGERRQDRTEDQELRDRKRGKSLRRPHGDRGRKPQHR